MQFWMAQIIGTILILLCMFMPQCKTRTSMIFLGFLANLCLLMQFWTLGAEGGVASSISTIIRSTILFLYAKKERVAPVYVVIGLMVLHITAISLAWQGLISILLLFSLFNIYGSWQKELQVTRLFAAITSSGFLFYSVISGAYTGALNEVILICSASIALWRFEKSKESLRRAKCCT